MMKKILWIVLLLTSITESQFAVAQAGVEPSSRAASLSVQASAQAIVGSARLVSAAVAVPLLVSGAVGTASGQLGASLLESNDNAFSTPLPVSDETVTAGPAPNIAISGRQD